MCDGLDCSAGCEGMDCTACCTTCDGCHGDCCDGCDCCDCDCDCSSCGAACESMWDWIASCFTSVCGCCCAVQPTITHTSVGGGMGGGSGGEAATLMDGQHFLEAPVPVIMAPMAYTPIQYQSLSKERPTGRFDTDEGEGEGNTKA